MKTVTLKANKMQEILATRESVKGKIEIRKARNQNDFLNNIMPDAVRIFARGIVESLAASAGIKSEDKIYDITDIFELGLKDEIVRFCRKELPDLIEGEDEEPDVGFEGGESDKVKEKKRAIKEDNAQFPGTDDDEFM